MTGHVLEDAKLRRREGNEYAPAFDLTPINIDHKVTDLKHSEASGQLLASPRMPPQHGMDLGDDEHGIGIQL
jgi:hypothetical protein